MSYGDDQVTILNRMITLIHFPVSDFIFALIFIFNLVLQRHDDVTKSSFKLKLKTDLKNIFETGKPHLDKLTMIFYHFIVSKQRDPGEIWPI